MTEFYPMPMFVKLQVRDLDHAVKWYKEAWDFEAVFQMTGMAHLRGAKYHDLMLVAANEINEAKGLGIVVNFAAEDVDAIAMKALSAGADIIEQPVIRPWNAKEFVVRDPDGYMLTFSQLVDRQKKFDEVIEAIR
ncbi:VOC family protein [Paenibacillus beijingensis]|uniref:Bleomycin resistance protein n=1 Tax=Paenibacillus beijingensis TaxID=1126833 RepID=A0A0D5NPI0_9BACL|nr:VOC family protein [Paenibacillus beijingensis]AJY77204.1 bleomycin resistance protein [Paenibacillus beijingensis]